MLEQNFRLHTSFIFPVEVSRHYGRFNMKWILASLSIIVVAIAAPAQAQPRKLISDGFRSFTTDLKSVDRVELYSVRMYTSKPDECTQANANCIQFRNTTLPIVLQRQLVGQKANNLAASLLQIEGGAGARCFNPTLLLQFYSNKKLVLATLMCFECGWAQLLDGSRIGLWGDANDSGEKLWNQVQDVLKEHPNSANELK